MQINIYVFQKNLADQGLTIIAWHKQMICQSKQIIKSPRYTGGDFMFLYRFVRRRRRRRPQILVHAITF